MRKCETIQDTKLAGYFACVPAMEYPQLRHFLSQPLGRTPPGTQILLFLMDFAEKKDWRSISLGELQLAIAHKKVHNRQIALAKEMSYAQRRLGEYWLAQLHPMDGPEADFALLTYQKERFGRMPTRAELDKLGQQLSESPYANHWELKKNWAIFNYSLALETQGRHPSISVQPVLDAIDLQYLREKLQYACVALNQDKILSTHHQFPFLDGIIEYVAEHSAGIPQVVQGYFLAFQMMSHPQDSAFSQQLFQLLYPPAAPASHKSDAAIRHGLPLADWQALSQYLDNHCLRQINQGDLSYLLLSAEVYAEQIKELPLGGNISLEPEKFKNMVLVLAEGGKLAAAESLFKDYCQSHSEFPHEKTPAFIEFSRGIIQFFKQDYSHSEIAFHHSTKLSDDIFMGINARLWMLKIYAETENWDALNNGLASYRIYIHRRKSRLPDRAPRYHSFQLALTQYLSAMEGTLTQKRMRLKDLEKEISQMKPNIHLRWLEKLIQRHFHQ